MDARQWMMEKGHIKPGRVREDVVPGYLHAHERVRRVRGTPSECHACGTTEAGRYEWALDKTTESVILTDFRVGRRYSTDVYAYVRLCVPCHRTLDHWANDITSVDQLG